MTVSALSTLFSARLSGKERRKSRWWGVRCYGRSSLAFISTLDTLLPTHNWLGRNFRFFLEFLPNWKNRLALHQRPKPVTLNQSLFDGNQLVPSPMYAVRYHSTIACSNSLRVRERPGVQSGQAKRSPGMASQTCVSRPGGSRRRPPSVPNRVHAIPLVKGSFWIGICLRCDRILAVRGR
jgi:hypothetical protein